MLILDFGSGETCGNDRDTITAMIDGLDGLKVKPVIKWQLFTKKSVPYLPPLTEFDYAYEYAQEKGYETTASVFDRDSLKKLQKYDTPFIKIANRPELYDMLKDIDNPLVSVPSVALAEKMRADGIPFMCCISAYPASRRQYCRTFHNLMKDGLSDHSTTWALYDTYTPKYYECHYALDGQTGQEVGTWTRTPEKLRLKF